MFGFTLAAFSGGGKGGKVTVLAGACQLISDKNKLKQRVTKLWISQKRRRRLSGPPGWDATKERNFSAAVDTSLF